MWDWACISATNRRVDQTYFSDGLVFVFLSLSFILLATFYFSLLSLIGFLPSDSLVILMCFFGPALVLYYEETDLAQLGRSDYRT